ncbi:receptor expression-enhancing protein 5-like [Acyrthosiphon pisum]|uniref:Receptor expression-enhancing protein n=1 Tax=Acyrthosiphon pisum TaxID=7029 RepID=A0A8R2NND0_ACYPI|nr:receptor expression-enhancing protein 5-like [Acyrthosiphon pisum]
MVRANKVKLVMEIMENILHDTSKPWTNFFGRVETRTGVPRLKLLIGILLVTSVILLVFGTNAMALSNAIGLIYPAKATVSLMISPPKRQNYAPAAAAAETQNKKFTYWLTFCAVLIVEQYCGFVLFLFPWYLLLRTLFLIWCSTPIRNSGAAFINAKVIYRIFKDCGKQQPTRRPHVNINCSKIQNLTQHRQPYRRNCLPPRRSPQTTSWRSALRK